MAFIRILVALIAIVTTNIATAANELTTELSIDDARHLLGRTGFGASAYQINQLLGKSRTEAIDSIVDGLTTGKTSIPPPEWINQPAPHHWAKNQLPKTARREFNEARYAEIEALRLWWVSEMIQTPTPQTERLILFWHNHFATGFSGIKDQAISIARQHMTFRSMGTGNFRALLKAIIRDPAMLDYLDNNNSRKSAPNENLARELLELFTLGEGNYTESDIKNAARALTGNSIAPVSNLQYQFKADLHDNGTKTIFGKRGNFNGDDVVDLILTQPAAAEFLATKFWRMLVSDSAPTEQQIKPIARQFRTADYDIRTLYRAVLQSDDFWAAANRASIVRSPVSLTVGTIRSTGIVPVSWQTLPNTMAQLGQQLFDPPNVAGWPGGRAWVTPGRLLNRLEWLNSLDNSCTGSACDPSTMNTMGGSNTGMSGDNKRNRMVAAESSDQLVIRMASEEFDGPARYKVTLLRGDILLWTSGEQALPGGHDTQRFGRIKNSKFLPWRNVSFQLPDHAKKFSTIEIEYLNDKNRTGVERNLFIEWASFNEKFYSAKQGTQTNNCPNRKNARHGSLLCNSKLLLSKASAVTTIPATAHDDTLSVAQVFLREVRDPKHGKGKKKFSYFSLTLSDVSLGDRHWHSITTLYGYAAKNKQYSLRLNSHGCWPDCLQEWPECSNITGDESASRTLAITLKSDRNKKYCAYDSLTTADKKLINTLWHSLPPLYELIKENPKLDRHKTQKAYSAWAPHVEKITGIVKSMQITPAEKPATFELKNKPTNQHTALYTAELPQPAGRNPAQLKDDFQTLFTQYPNSDLRTVLLPVATDAQTITNPALQDVLTSLAFQLK